MDTYPSLKDKTVCVVDAYGLVYQAFYAHRATTMSNARGEPTGAVFGFVRDILSIMTKLPIDYLFCAYDMHAKTFRSDVYPEYKANRPPTPDDLMLQFDFTREFLKGVGAPALGVIGYEADDVMATVQRRVAQSGGKTILVTSDKDARQLISDATTIYLIRQDKYYNAAELKDDWGVAPNQVVDFQALVGDTSDNVPGVPLVGPKIAGELLQEFGTLEGVREGVQNRKGKRFDNIRNCWDQALLSRELVRLRQDVPLDIDWDSGKLDGVDPERLRRLFQYWRFRSLVGRIDELTERFGVITAEESEWFNQLEARRNTRMSVDVKPRSQDGIADGAPLLSRLRRPLYGAISIPAPDDARDDIAPDAAPALVLNSIESLADLPLPDVAPRSTWRATIVDDSEKLSALVARLQETKLFALAVITREEPEVGRVRARDATLCGLAIAMEPDEAFYLPFRASLGANLLDKEDALEKLRPALESPSIAKLGFELKYDAIALMTSGIQMRGLAFDVAIADYLALAGATKRSIADVASSYLDVKLFDLKSATGTGKKRVPLDFLAPEIIAQYALDTVLVPLNAASIIRQRIMEIPALEKLALDLETPLAETLAEMEYNGIAIDRTVFQDVSEEMLKRREALEKEIRECVKESDPDPAFAYKINLNSPLQLQRLLFEDLKLPVIKKTKTGASVDAEVLEELASMHEIPRKIVKLRKLVKLCGTYLEPLPRQTAPGTNRICATFHQSATATGRLSSSDPNLQNIPARSGSGKLIRSGFVPDASQGYDAFLSCDYSQIELRVLAHFSGDPALRQAFIDNKDVHSSVAAQIFGVDEEDVTPDMRRKAKAVNFGLVYGQTPFGLSRSIDVPIEAASEYIDKFFATYPGTLSFFDRVLDDCAKKGYVETLLGRRRALTGVRGARGRKSLNFPERAAINAVVQGSAADIMKLAMLAVWRRLKREGWTTSRWSPLAEPDETPRPEESTPALGTATPLFSAKLYEPHPSEERAEAPREVSVRDVPPERARLLLQIHDELLFETRRDDADELAKLVVEEMSLNNPLSAPLRVDTKIGVNWGEL